MPTRGFSQQQPTRSRCQMGRSLHVLTPERWKDVESRHERICANNTSAHESFHHLLDGDSLVEVLVSGCCCPGIGVHCPDDRDVTFFLPKQRKKRNKRTETVWMCFGRESVFERADEPGMAPMSDRAWMLCTTMWMWLRRRLSRTTGMISGSELSGMGR